MTHRVDDNVVVFSRATGSLSFLERILLRRSAAVHCFSTRQECLRGLRACPCGLLIVDCDGRAAEELGVLVEARQLDRWIAAIVLVETGGIARAVEAMRCGASDCLEKPVREESLLAAMDQALSTRPRHAADVQALTRAETRVLQLILEGKTSGQIAGMLYRSTRTVEVHRRRIQRKLNVRGMVDLLKWALSAGMMEATPDKRWSSDFARCTPTTGSLSLRPTGAASPPPPA